MHWSTHVGVQIPSFSFHQAIYLVLKHDPDPNLKLEIYTDSQYSINCMRSLSTSPSFFFISETKTDIKQRGYNQGLTKWLSNWLRNDWKTSSGKPVENRDLIDSIRNQLFSRDQIHRNGVKLVYVKGHAGIHGNEEADRLACMGALKEPISQLVLSWFDLFFDHTSDTDGGFVGMPICKLGRGQQWLKLASMLIRSKRESDTYRCERKPQIKTICIVFPCWVFT